MARIDWRRRKRYCFAGSAYFGLAGLHLGRTLEEDLCRRPLAGTGMRMIKRLVSMAAMIGGAILSMVLAPDAAWAEKRVALVVGNSSYQTVPQLPNPARDASSVAKMFKDAGFDSVDIALNVGNLEFKRAIRKFETAADQ